MKYTMTEKETDEMVIPTIELNSLWQIKQTTTIKRHPIIPSMKFFNSSFDINTLPAISFAKYRFNENTHNSATIVESAAAFSDK